MSEDKLKPILHICNDGEKQDVADQVSCGFKFCCWCGEKYVQNEPCDDAEIIEILKAIKRLDKHVGKLLMKHAGG